MLLDAEAHGGSIALDTNTNDASAPPAVDSGHFDVVGAPGTHVPFNGSLEDLLDQPEYATNEAAELDRASALSHVRRSAWEAKAPVNLLLKHKYIAQLFALGFQTTEISAKTGYSKPWLSVVSRHPKFIAEVDAIRKDIFKDTLEQRLRVSLPQAAKVIETVLNDDSEKSALRVDTAFRLFDRTHGKPPVRVEHTGSLLKDLFAELDARGLADANSPGATSLIDIPAEWTETKTTENADASTEASATKDPVTAFIEQTYEEREKTPDAVE